MATEKLNYVKVPVSVRPGLGTGCTFENFRCVGFDNTELCTKLAGPLVVGTKLNCYRSIFLAPEKVEAAALTVITARLKC